MISPSGVPLKHHKIPFSSEIRLTRWKCLSWRLYLIEIFLQILLFGIPPGTIILGRYRFVNSYPMEKYSTRWHDIQSFQSKASKLLLSLKTKLNTPKTVNMEFPIPKVLGLIQWPFGLYLYITFKFKDPLPPPTSQLVFLGVLAFIVFFFVFFACNLC